jgi:hypothetical protein
MRDNQSTNLFPFTITDTSYGLNALWIKYKPQCAVWSTVECTIMSSSTVVFTTYRGWNAQRQLADTFELKIASDDLVPYITQRKKSMVNAIFALEELEREQARISKRKAEIYNNLFNEE